jgi:hypothetical protein
MTGTGSTPNASGTNLSTGQTGGSAVAAAKDTARNLVDQAKTTASDAYGVVAEKATSKLEEQKSTLAGGLTSVAESVRSMGDNLNQSPEKNPLADYTAQYAGTAAQKLDEFAGYFERKDIKDMARDIESFARRNPALFLGGAFALGMLAARFIKSSPTSFHSRNFNTGIDHQLPPAGTTRGTNLGTSTGASMTGIGTTGTSFGPGTRGGGLGSTGSTGTANTPGTTGTTGTKGSGGTDKPNLGNKTPGAM